MLSEEQIGLLWSKWVATGKGGLELIKMTEQALLTPLDDEKIVERMADILTEYFCLDVGLEKPIHTPRSEYIERAQRILREIAPSIKESGRQEVIDKFEQIANEYDDDEALGWVFRGQIYTLKGER